MSKRHTRRHILGVIGLICATVLAYFLFNIKFLAVFYKLPYITGYDGAAHLAMMDIYSRTIFPAFWGWVPNWYAGMPIPLFYPPVAYYVGSLLLHIIHSPVLAYKVLAYTATILSIITAVFVLKKIFKDEELIARHHGYMRAGFWSIFAGIILVFSLNPGAPSLNAIFIDSTLSQQISIIWFLLGFYALLRKERFYNFLAIFCWALIYVTNAHTAMAAACTVLCITLSLPFAYHAKNQISVFFDFVKRLVWIQAIAIGLSSFWTIPMLAHYEYFAGITTVDWDLSLRFFYTSWPILIILILAIIISNLEEKKIYRQIHIGILAMFIFLGIVEVLTHTLNIVTVLPVQLWRWYETVLVLCIIPTTYISFFVYKKSRVMFGVLLILFLTFIVLKDPNLRGVNLTYEKDQGATLVSELSNLPKKVSDGLTLVHGRGYPEFTINRQLILDSELGRSGVYTVFHNLRESSINSLFLRIAKMFISQTEEGWALINYTSKPFTLDNKIDIESHTALLDFLGISRIIAAKEDVYLYADDIRLDNIKSYRIDKSSLGFIVFDRKTDISRAVQVNSPLTLFIGDAGFRDRSMTDPTWSRFQETVFEKGLFKHTIAFTTSNNDIEENISEMDRADIIIIAKTNSTNIQNTIHELSKQPNKTIYILDDGSKQTEVLKRNLSQLRNTHIISPANEFYPFDDIADAIVKKSKSNQQSTKSSKQSLVNVPIEFTGNNLIHIEPLPQSATSSPILVKHSFFHPWQAEALVDGNASTTAIKTYLASPGYTLLLPGKTVKTNSITLHLTTPRSVIIGHLVSLAFLALCFFIAILSFIFTKGRDRMA